MTLRSRLFAGVALPLLSVAMTVQPVFAANDQQPFEIAQSSDEQQPVILPDEQPQEQAAEQKPKKRHAEEQAPAEEQAAPQPEPQAQAPAEAQPEAAPAEQEQPSHKRRKQAAEEQQPAEQQAQPEAAPAEQPQRKHKKQAAEEAAPAEQQAAPQPEAAPAEQPQRKHKKQQEPAAQAPAEQQPAAQQAQPEAAPAEQPQAPQRKHKKQSAEEAAPAEQQAAPQSEATPAEQPQHKHKKQQPEPEAQAPAEQPQQPAQQQQPEAAPVEQQPEQPASKHHKQTQQQPAEQPQTEGQQPQTEGAPAQPAPAPQTQGENGAAAPAPDATAQQPAAPPIVDKRSAEEQKAIAADPSKTDETVVLPVTNGAAVLDSDKDADNRGGQSSRDERRRQREAQRSDQAAPPPKNDAEAQAAAPQVNAEQVRQQIEEKGQRIDKAPQFALPTGVEGGGAMQSGAADGQNAGSGRRNRQSGQGGEAAVNNIVVLQQNDNRTVFQVDNHLVVRGDDRPRLSRDAEDTHYDRLPRGRYRETIERPNGVRLITIYNQYGDIIQRSRIGSDGEEYLLVYAPDADRDEPPVVYDAGRDLPPMRLRIPVEDYIIDTSSEPDRDYYDFLAEPPVERVERTYSIDEVKYSARLRDKVRRIDLDTITFATGSAEVPMNQARTLRKVADAIQKLLKRDPGETFLIEGHTDAVGSDQSNLILSDKRADSVASLLTEVYGIPPENMTTQGYGERYLKVRTQAAEQQNRRVTIRRVTPLVRPVAKN